MPNKTPVLLLVWIETKTLRWFVASLGLDHQFTPLLCSEPGDLELYRGLDFDHQVSFLRHRLCGILQRGCDRLWPRGWKACQFVFLFEEPLPEATGTLTRTVAQHFAEWMHSPPVAVYNVAGSPTPELLGGTLEGPYSDLLRDAIPRLRQASADEGVWEVSHQKSTFHLA